MASFNLSTKCGDKHKADIYICKQSVEFLWEPVITDTVGNSYLSVV